MAMSTVVTMAKKRASKSTEYRSVALHGEVGEILERLADEHGLRLNQAAGNIIKWFVEAPETLQQIVLRGHSYDDSMRIFRLLASGGRVIPDLDDAAGERSRKPAGARRRKRAGGG